MDRAVDPFLAHYGVKGMRWGHRKERAAVEVTANTRAGKRVKTSGGQHHMPSEDAVRVASARQKAKMSTTDSLSNRELQDVVTRMNLEQQFNNLNRTSGGAGKQFAKMLLGMAGEQQVGDFVSKQTNNPAAGDLAKVVVSGAKSMAGGGGGGKKKKR